MLDRLFNGYLYLIFSINMLHACRPSSSGLYVNAPTNNKVDMSRGAKVGGVGVVATPPPPNLRF